MAYRDAVLADSPVAYWRMGESSGTTAADETGNGHNGAYNGGYSLGQSGALPYDSDKAVMLNGAAGSYVAISNHANFQVSTGTMEAWIKTSNPGSSFRGIVIKQFAYGMFLEDGKLITFEWVGGGGARTNVALNDGEWHHVVATFQSGVTNGSHVYIDGVHVTAWTHQHNNHTAALAIGTGYPDGSQQNIAGTIDEVAIYDYALTAQQVADHYNAAVTPPQPDTPTGLNVSLGSLSWGAVSNADTYDVRWSTDETTWTTVQDVASPWQHTPRTESTTFYYQVRACNEHGCSDWSASVSETTPGPGQYVVAFTPSDAQSTNPDELSWQIRTASDGGGNLVASGTATSGIATTTDPIDDAWLVNGVNDRWLYVTDGAGNVLDQPFNVVALFEEDIFPDGVAAISVEGDVTVIGDIPASGDTAIAATGDATIAPEIGGEAAIGATGHLDITILISIEPSGEAAIGAEGNLSIVNVAVLGGDATVAADGAIHITADVPVSGDAAIGATGEVSISPQGIAGDAAIGAEGDATISPEISGDAAIGATGDISIEGEIPPSGDAAIDATGDISIEGEIPPSGDAAIAATGDLDIELAGFEIRGHRLRAEFNDAQGNPIGAGPVVDIISASYSLHLDEVGEFEIEIPASHPIAGEIAAGCRMRLYREGEGLVYQGIVHTPRIVVPESGEYTLNIAGDSVARELVWANTLFGREYSNTAMPSVVNALLSGTGWTATTNTDSRNLTAQFEAASIWRATAHAAEMFGWHVRENNLTRTIDVGPLGAASGLILQNVTHIEQDMAVVPIRSLSLASEQADLWNQVVPVGGGDGINVLTLRYSNRNSPYAIQSAAGPNGQSYWYIQDAASINAHGVRVMPLSFPDVVPLSNSIAEIRNAANALYDVASAWLGWHAQAHETYEVQIAGINHYDDGTPVIRVGDTVRLIYRGLVLDQDGETVVWKDVDANVYILSLERSFGTDDLNAWNLTVSTTSHQAPGDAEAVAQAIDDLWAVQTSKRPYTYYVPHGPMVESVASGQTARLLVRFDQQITYLHRAVLSVRKRRVKSNVTGSAGGGGQTVPAGTPQTALSGGTPTSQGGGSHGHSITATATPSGGGHTSDTGSAHTHTVTGGTAVGSGEHWHQVGDFGATSAWQTQPFQQQVRFRTGPQPTSSFHGVFTGRGSSGGSGTITTLITTDHQHSLTGIANLSESSHRHPVLHHQHTISAHVTQTVTNHQHNIQPHSHAINDHTHELPNHSHALVYGIFLGPTANSPQFNVTINGTNRTSTLGGPWNNDFEVDITQYLVDGQGQPLRQANNIDIGSNQLCDVEMLVRTFVTSHSIVPV